MKEILAALDASAAEVREHLPFISDAQLGEIWHGVSGGKRAMSMPRRWLIRMIMLNHWVHHRGQLGVYLRMLGAKVPSSYGPSADERMAGA